MGMSEEERQAAGLGVSRPFYVHCEEQASKQAIRKP